MPFHLRWDKKTALCHWTVYSSQKKRACEKNEKSTSTPCRNHRIQKNNTVTLVKRKKCSYNYSDLVAENLNVRILSFFLTDWLTAKVKTWCYSRWDQLESFFSFIWSFSLESLYPSHHIQHLWSQTFLSVILWIFLNICFSCRLLHYISSFCVQYLSWLHKQQHITWSNSKKKDCIYFLYLFVIYLFIIWSWPYVILHFFYLFWQYMIFYCFFSLLHNISVLFWHFSVDSVFLSFKTINVDGEEYQSTWLYI